jgi:N-acetylmuramoyl-L-alanine amidase
MSVLLLPLMLLSGCSGLTRHGNLEMETWPSPNHGVRRPQYVILHHTTNATAEEALATLTSPWSRVSAHYLIGRDGRIHYLVDELRRAWHAGGSYWGGNRDLNSASIGIELDNDGAEPFADAQIEALIELLHDITRRWRLPPQNVLGHGDVAPGRKSDPSAWFPWRRLAQAGLGLWCEPPYPEAPAGAPDELLLAALGYDISRPELAVAAFRRRWAGREDDRVPLGAEERGLLACLLRQR